MSTITIYKLVKEYPNSPELGTYIRQKRTSPMFFEYPGYTIERPERYLEFWAPTVVHPKTEEYLSVGDTVYIKDQEYPRVIRGFNWDTKYGEWLVSISDEFDAGYYGKKGCNIKIVSKTPPKKVLFTTEDGVDVYEGDEYYSILNPELRYLGKFRAESPNNGKFTNPKTCKVFSTKKSAEEYILMNKPCLSINDVLSINEWKLDSVETKTSTIKKLKKLVQQKL